MSDQITSEKKKKEYNNLAQTWPSYNTVLFSFSANSYENIDKIM